MGYEDYTYSNYFYGRSANEGVPGNQGIAAQQIMVQGDGALKLCTDLLSGWILASAIR